ncbi:hypothetical protein ABZS61_25410 [Streptomyces sp. NPDC005566]
MTTPVPACTASRSTRRWPNSAAKRKCAPSSMFWFTEAGATPGTSSAL